jgi:hypothetical protein
MYFKKWRKNTSSSFSFYISPLSFIQSWRVVTTYCLLELLDAWEQMRIHTYTTEKQIYQRQTFLFLIMHVCDMINRSSLIGLLRLNRYCLGNHLFKDIWQQKSGGSKKGRLDCLIKIVINNHFQTMSTFYFNWSLLLCVCVCALACNFLFITRDNANLEYVWI